MTHGQAGAVRTIHLGRRPVLSAWGDTRQLASITARLDGSTPRRRLVRLAGHLLLTSRTFPAAARITARAPGLNGGTTAQEALAVADAVGRIARDLAIPVAGGIIVWPTGDRSHRRYVLTVDSDGEPGLFAKVSRQPETDGSSFAREAAALEWLADRHDSRWRTPLLLHQQVTPAMAILLFAPLPPTSGHLGYDDLRAILPLGPIQEVTHPLTSLPWARSAANLPEASDSFVALLAEAIASPVQVGLVHGDIRPSNALICAGENHLIDWEFSSVFGPARADLVSARINELTDKDATADTDSVLSRLLTGCAADGLPATEVALAIGYLVTIGQPVARRLVAAPNWPTDINPDPTFGDRNHPHHG